MYFVRCGIHTIAAVYGSQYLSIVLVNRDEQLFVFVGLYRKAISYIGRFRGNELSDGSVWESTVYCVQLR